MRAADLTRACLAALVLLVADLAPTTSWADGRAPAATRAEELFEQGKQQFDTNDLERACASLAESDRLDPRVGTLGLLAACREKRGQLVAARRAYLEAAERARAAGDDRERFARESAAALESKLGRVTVHLGADRGGAEVSVGGEPQRVEAGSIAIAFADPGDVAIRVSERGRMPWRRVLHVEQGTHVHVEVPPPAEARVPVSRAPWVARSGGLPPLAIGAGAAAIAGLGVGVGFGVAAIVRANEADPYCDAGDRCSPTGGSIRDDARTLARVSTVGFGAAAVGAGVAIAALLTADDEPEPARSAKSVRVRVAPAVAPRSGGATLRGSF